MLAQYRRAAALGNAEANFRLGEIHASAKGRQADNLQAYIYFSFAALDGHAGAAARRDTVSPLLQPAEIQQAEKLIRDRRRRGKDGKG